MQVMKGAVSMAASTQSRVHGDRGPEESGGAARHPGLVTCIALLTREQLKSHWHWLLLKDQVQCCMNNHPYIQDVKHGGSHVEVQK